MVDWKMKTFNVLDGLAQRTASVVEWRTGTGKFLVYWWGLCACMLWGLGKRSILLS